MGATALFAGTAMQAFGSVYGGMRQKSADDAAAAQLQQNAGQIMASGIQRSEQEQRKAAYVGSKAQADIAAGGLTTTGASAQRTRSLIAGQGDYNSAQAIYEGEYGQQEELYHAATLRSEGDAAETAGFINAASEGLAGYSKYAGTYGRTGASLTGSGTSFFDRYGNGGPD